MGGSSTKCQRAITSVTFILKSYYGVFTVVSKENIQVGDVIFFKMEIKSGSSSCMHAGVYFGEKEVVHFDGYKVCKEGIDAMEKKRGKYWIVRPKQGINKEAFMKNVKLAMNADIEYHWIKNNCIHFALFLLGMTELYENIVERVVVGNGNHEGEPVVSSQCSDNTFKEIEKKLKCIGTWSEKTMTDGQSHLEMFPLRYSV